jgi:hypothetical protein
MNKYMTELPKIATALIIAMAIYARIKLYATALPPDLS